MGIEHDGDIRPITLNDDFGLGKKTRKFENVKITFFKNIMSFKVKQSNGN